MNQLLRWKTMYLAIVVCILSSAESRIFPTYNFIASDTADCGGSERAIAFVSSSISPDPILNPGDAHVTTQMRVLRNVTFEGVRAKLSITKLEPRRMRLPCFRRFGSCGYDACDMILTHPEIFCPMFPYDVPCGCQLTQGSYSAQDAIVSLPRFGPIIRRVMQGNYAGNLTFVTNTNRVLGCLSLQFAIKNQAT